MLALQVVALSAALAPVPVLHLIGRNVVRDVDSVSVERLTSCVEHGPLFPHL